VKLKDPPDTLVLGSFYTRDRPTAAVARARDFRRDFRRNARNLRSSTNQIEAR
jgi:hypothetical protein